MQNKQAPQVTTKKSTGKTEFKFQKPSQKNIVTAGVLCGLGIVFFFAICLFGNTQKKDILERTIGFFETKDSNIEMKYHMHKMRENFNMEKRDYVPENQYAPKLIDNGIAGMFFLNELGVDVDRADIFKLYKDYAFIEDLQQVKEVLPKEEPLGDEDEDAEKKDETTDYIITSKPQSIYASFYAHELLKKKDGFKAYVEQEEFKNVVEFVLKMQSNETGIFSNDKTNKTDIRVMYMATSLLKDALEYSSEEVKPLVKKSIELAQNFFVKSMLPDGSYDVDLTGNNGTCQATEYAYLAMTNLGMQIKKNTNRYVMKCNSEKGPLITLTGDYVSTECGYLLSEIMKIIPNQYKTENLVVKDILKGCGIMCIGFGIAFLFIETYPTKLVKEYFISAMLFVVCQTISLIFMNDTSLLYFIFPVGIMGYTHFRKWIMPLIKDEFFSTICMIPSLVAILIWILLSKFVKSLFFSFSFIPVMWIAFIVASYFAVPICKLFFKKENHPVNYYVECNAIGFAFMIICMFVTIAMSANRIFILNIISFVGQFTNYVAWPVVGYILSMIACGLAIPKFKNVKGKKK